MEILKKIEIPEVKKDSNQIDMFDPVDSDNRNRKTIEKLSRSLIKKTLDSIEMRKDGKWYIEGKLADDWIKDDEALHDERGARTH